MDDDQQRKNDQGTLRSLGRKSIDDDVPLMRSKEGTMERKTADNGQMNNGGQAAAAAEKARRSGPKVECSVSVPDGSVCTVEISKNSIGQDLVDAITDKLNLLEKDYFACSYKKRDFKFWLKNEKSISKQIKGLPWEFSFDVKFYPLDPTALHEELTRYQVYLQVRDDISSGRLPCSFVTLALLGSYVVQSQLGDYEPDEHGSGIEYIKKIRFAPSQTEELLFKVSEIHRTHRGQLPDEAEMHYLENAKNMALYGTHIHPAINCADNERISVGVCASGVMIYKDRIRLNRFVWAKIMMISYKRNNFIVKIRPNPGEDTKDTELIHKYKLENLEMAKRLWRLAVEHHAFFRLREPDTRDVKKRFSRAGSKYRYTGRTQYQSQQAADQISRSNQNVNRGGLASDRFVWDRTLDPSTPGFSVDRSAEQIVMTGNMTATLDLKNRKKGFVPFADSEDEANPGYGGRDYGGSRGELASSMDPVGRAVYIKTTHPSTSSAGDVFLEFPGDRRPSQNELLLAGNRQDLQTPGTGYNPGSFENVKWAGQTPYPGKAGYITPGGPGYMTPDGLSYGGGPPGYMTPGTPQYGIDDMRREHSNDVADGNVYMNAGYGTGRYDNKWAGTPGADMNGRYPDGSQPGGNNFQDDHLKQQGQFGAAGGEGQWGKMTTTTVKTTTRTFTAPDGTLVTEHRTEKDGVIETRIENRKSVDFDYDKALADAILSVTDVDQNLSVEKIEIRRDE